jgi:hypothetical protein
MFIDYKNTNLRFTERFAEYGGGITTTADGPINFTFLRQYAPFEIRFK